MKKYKYACLELNVKLQDESKVACVKIPFDDEREAWEYLCTHYDADFHSNYWIE